MLGVGEWSIGNEGQWGSLTNRALGFEYLPCHSFRLQVYGTGQEGSQKLTLAQDEGGLWSCGFQGPFPGGGQAGLHPRAPGPPASPSVVAQGVSCSLRTWLEGKSHPGSWQSLPYRSHPRSNQRKAQPSWLWWVPWGPGGRTGQGASAVPRTPSQDPRSERPHSLASSCGAPGSATLSALDRGPHRLPVGRARHILAPGPSWRQSGR